MIAQVSQWVTLAGVGRYAGSLDIDAQNRSQCPVIREHDEFAYAEWGCLLLFSKRYQFLLATAPKY